MGVDLRCARRSCHGGLARLRHNAAPERSPRALHEDFKSWARRARGTVWPPVAVLWDVHVATTCGGTETQGVSRLRAGPEGKRRFRLVRIDPRFRVSLRENLMLVAQRWWAYVVGIALGFASLVSAAVWGWKFGGWVTAIGLLFVVAAQSHAFHTVRQQRDTAQEDVGACLDALLRAGFELEEQIVRMSQQGHGVGAAFLAADWLGEVRAAIRQGSIAFLREFDNRIDAERATNEDARELVEALRNSSGNVILYGEGLFGDQAEAGIKGAIDALSEIRQKVG